MENKNINKILNIIKLSTNILTSSIFFPKKLIIYIFENKKLYEKAILIANIAKVVKVQLSTYLLPFG